MPTPLSSADSMESFAKSSKENEVSENSYTNAIAEDSDVDRCRENYKPENHQTQQQQAMNYNGSQYHKFGSRPNQSGSRQNRNNSANKRPTSDSNNNNKNISGNKLFTYKGAHLTQQKMFQNEHQKLSNGHVLEASKKSLHKSRSITKANQAGSYHYDEVFSHNSAPEDSSKSTSPNLSGRETEALPRKYSMDFLHQLGYKMTGNTSPPDQNSPKTPKHMDEANLMALKLALGDNSNYYNHFVASAMYGNQIIMQQHQYQQQNFSRYQQSQQQPVQHLQRFYRGQHEGYPRMYSFRPEQEQSSITCSQSSQQLQRTFSQSYSNPPSYQNRNKSDRDFRDKRFRNDYRGHQNFRNKNYNRNGYLLNANGYIDESSTNNTKVTANRRSSEEQVYRSLSPTPPNSSKSSSPGAQDKDVGIINTFEVTDDSVSTASASSSSDRLGSTSYNNGLKSSLSAPVLAPEEPAKNINLWIDNNFSNGLHNGLSASAEHLSNHSPVSIVKRPPSEPRKQSDNGVQKKYHSYAMKNCKTPQYDPQYPFEYYLSRANESEMRLVSPNLRSGSVWDQMSVEMWCKFQINQQSRETYCNKMQVWRVLFDCAKSFPLFQQKAFPKWGLFLVGSTISGFGSDTSDVDMCLVSKGNHSDSRFDARTEAMVTLNNLKNFLNSSMSPFQNFTLIHAKVPILRFRDASNTIEIDLNYNNCVGVRNTHLLNSYSQLDWRLRPLALIVKLWAQFHNINDARNSTISSYSLVLMVIHFLQSAVKPAVLPCLHRLNPDSFHILHDITTIDMVEKCEVNWISENHQTLGELFVQFLDYYMNFDYANNAISIRTGGVLPIEECKNARSLKNDPNHWQTLCIEEPFDLTNTARSAYDGEIFLKIKEVFRQSWYRLKETRQLESVFTTPLFVQTQQQQMSQLTQFKYMTIAATGPGTSPPVMGSVNEIRS